MTVAIELLNGWADPWSTWVVAGSLDAAALLGLAALVWWLIRRRVSPQVGYALFLLVPLKLLAPVVVAVPEGLARWTPSGRVASWFEPTPAPRAVEPRPRFELPIATPSFDTPPIAGPPRAIPAPRPSAPEAPAPPPRTQSTPEPRAARMSLPAVALIAWLAGVLVLLGRLVASQWRFGVRLRQARPVDASRLGVDLDEIVRLSGVSRRVRFVEADSIASPAVWGIIRPTIILPSRLDLTLKPRELRWVLLHELAHVRRFDLLILATQRAAALAHFFNPTVWVANRIINQLREYACDDFATSLAQASPIEAGEAFVGTLRHADRTRTGLEAQGALGIFGLDPRSSCFSRVKRLLDAKRTARPSMSLSMRCALVLLAVCTLPHLRAIGDSAQAPAAAPRPDQPNVGIANPDGRNNFELSVVGPGGKPIAGARIDLRNDSTPTAEQILRGKLFKEGSGTAIVEADAEGKVEVAFPKPPTGLVIHISTPGFGPYRASWQNPFREEPPPARFTAELEPAWSMSGTVVDSEGKPIGGTRVGVSIPFKERPGGRGPIHTNEGPTTDASGHWRYDSVPVSLDQVFVNISHPDFTPILRTLSRSDFEDKPDRKSRGMIGLSRGVKLTGTVTDDAGVPIADALVRSKFINNVCEARTLADGTYRLVGCPEGAARIVVSAKGRATETREITIDGAMGPVDFRLKPGGTVRVRVVDVAGKPMPRARILPYRRGGTIEDFDFKNVNIFADADGLWVWDEAPLGEFYAQVCPPGKGMQLPDRPLIARDQDYFFRIPAPLVISGKVVDSVTKQPIKTFRVVPGIRSSETEMDWCDESAFLINDGRYQITHKLSCPAYLVRIEADGYQTAVSREIKSDEGSVSVDFELERRKDSAGRVVTPDNLPASRAEVASPGAQPSAKITLPHPRAVGDPAPARAVVDDKIDRGGEHQFELSVVGLGGKPIAGASVELRIDPIPTADQIRRGKFIKQGTYGASVKSDPEGKVEVAFSKPPTGLNVDITTPGFGPYWARWSTGTEEQPVPARFTAELEAGWSVGGVVVDPTGKPVEGAKVHPSIEFKKRPGDLQQLGVGVSVTTDASGRWRFDSVPASMGEVFVEVNHPDFGPVRRALTRSGFGIEPGGEPAGKIALERGLMVTGTVTDDAGKPIVGALVRSKFVNNIREAKTWADGTYKLVGCEPSTTRIVVSSKGRATDMREVTVDPDLGPVDFRMKPGGTVRIRVLDHQGRPEARARIFFQKWRGPIHYFEFNHIDQYADELGVWVWNDAPLDEFAADICPSGRDGMQLINQPIVPRDEEYVFRLPPTLVVSGRVIDSATKAPVERFRVVRGDRSRQGQPWWNDREGFEATDGHYGFRDTQVEQVRLVRVEADGYLPAVSRDIKDDEGKVSVDFELVRGANVAAKVVTPDFKPASGAKVALGVGDAQIGVVQGEISDSWTYAPRRNTDADGRFDFPAQDKDFHLVITHPSGYAHIASTDEWNTVKVIRLQPWSRVEGTFRIGREPAPNVPLWVEAPGQHPSGKSLRIIINQYEATTGPDGKYVFERVIPGGGGIGRRLMLTVDDGALDVTSSTMIPVQFTAGETIRLDLGGTGRAVVGRLQPPEGFNGRVRWSFALVTVKPEAAGEREASPSFTATIGRDGSFRIDDMPEGDYSLTVRFDPNHDDVGFLFNHPYKVPAPDEARPDNPFDLGTLRLKAAGPR